MKIRTLQDSLLYSYDKIDTTRVSYFSVTHSDPLRITLIRFHLNDFSS